MNLFEQQARQAAEAGKPLAERVRPRSLGEFVGQTHMVGRGALIHRAIEQDRLFSMILWGPPGCGKTTLARIVASETESHFVQFSAVLSGVKEIRAVIDAAREQLRLRRRKTILFVDEIHRFNKAQQDAFLHHVESGLITLIGATTENPSFEVIAPLLSRCRVIPLKPLEEEEIGDILDRALADAEGGLANSGCRLDGQARALMIRLADGDARMALNNLELVVGLKSSLPADAGGQTCGAITVDEIEAVLQKKALRYDKSGEAHYNLISALHKSLRGSDPDAALYWLGRMLAAGEDPLYIARRMVRFASEDVGMADPNALVVAMQAMQAYHFIGSPEGDLALAQTAVYLATAPKSNRIYAAFGDVQTAIRRTGSLPVPKFIRNAPTRLMKEMGYGKGYRYDHDFKDAYAGQNHLPEKLAGKTFYHPSRRGFEKTVRERLQRLKEAKGK